MVRARPPAGCTRAQVKVCVVDTGSRSDHEDLSDNLMRGWNALYNNTVTDGEWAAAARELESWVLWLGMRRPVRLSPASAHPLSQMTLGMARMPLALWGLWATTRWALPGSTGR